MLSSFHRSRARFENEQLETAWFDAGINRCPCGFLPITVEPPHHTRQWCVSKRLAEIVLGISAGNLRATPRAHTKILQTEHGEQNVFQNQLIRWPIRMITFYLVYIWRMLWFHSRLCGYFWDRAKEAKKPFDIRVKTESENLLRHGMKCVCVECCCVYI